MNYREKAPISAREVVDRTKSLKGAVAIAYRDAPDTRAVLCQKPFACTPIRKNFFGRPFTQLLAVKEAGR